MSHEPRLAFVAASAVLLIIPGPTILTVISYSSAHGRCANIPLVAAVGLGDSSALVVSLLGLGALLATSAFWFTVVKCAGGLYHTATRGSCRDLCGHGHAQRPAVRRFRSVGAQAVGIAANSASLRSRGRFFAFCCWPVGIVGKAAGMKEAKRVVGGVSPAVPTPPTLPVSSERKPIR